MVSFSFLLFAVCFFFTLCHSSRRILFIDPFFVHFPPFFGLGEEGVELVMLARPRTSDIFLSSHEIILPTFR